MKALKGQALVEMTIIAPILIIMLFGVFEVGYALRAYLVLVSASREAARIAAKPIYMVMTDDYSTNAAADYYYDHTLDFISNQIDFEHKGELIITFIQVTSSSVCDPADTKYLNCDCDLAATRPYSQAIVKYPDAISNTNYLKVRPITASLTTQLVYSDIITQAVQYNNKMSCIKSKQSGYNEPIHISYVYAELYYTHTQLFGFPLIANPYTDPLLMYARATMRVENKRD